MERHESEKNVYRTGARHRDLSVPQPGGFLTDREMIKALRFHTCKQMQEKSQQISVEDKEEENTKDEVRFQPRSSHSFNVTFN